MNTIKVLLIIRAILCWIVLILLMGVVNYYFGLSTLIINIFKISCVGVLLSIYD